MSRVKQSLQTPEFYKCYVQYMTDKGQTPKPYPQYKAIVETMGKVMNGLLVERGIIGLPWRNGDIYLKRKAAAAFIDWKATREAGKRMYGFNDHTEGIAYTPFWLSPDRINKRLLFWLFESTRSLNKNLNHAIRNGKQYPDFKLMMK